MRTITISLSLHDGPGFKALAYEPTPDSPLVITRPTYWAGTAPECARAGWVVTHVPSGKRLGYVEYSTRAAAAAFIARCQPSDPVWTSSAADALSRCHALYQAAMEG